MPLLGVRTESWTAGRSGLEVRMYSREKVELFLLATEDGMGPTAAAEFAGVTVSAAKKWATGHLPRSYTGGGCRIVARKPPRKEASLGPDKSIYAPPATGPLAGLNEDQIENLLLRAVLADLKAEGWDPASISNRSKCELGERLRRATALPLRSITGFLRISKSSYEYWRPRVAAPRDRDADIRGCVVRIFREGSGCWGYRTVWARLRREGVRASEKRVARVMREEGLEVVYNKRRARGYSSYAGEVSKAPENLVNRNFHADEPNRLWLTDITEFRLPGGRKVYLSPIVDCFDGMPVAWSVGLHPDKRLANSSLLKALAARPAGGRTTIHSDRGGHYRWPEWIGICEENGLVRSMSAKGCSPDNSACEGFFGRLKNEFFRYRDWEGVTPEEFIGRLEAYLVYYREERIKKSLGWLKLGYAKARSKKSSAPPNGGEIGRTPAQGPTLKEKRGAAWRLRALLFSFCSLALTLRRSRRGRQGLRSTRPVRKSVYERLRLARAPAAMAAVPARAAATMAAFEVSPVAASTPVVLAFVIEAATALVGFEPSGLGFCLDSAGLLSAGLVSSGLGSSGLATSGGAMTMLLATASL